MSAPVKPLPTLGGAPIGQVFHEAPSRSLSRTDPFESDGDPAALIISALRQADSGYPMTMQLAIESALAKDLRLRTVVATRILAITSRTYVVKPPPGFENDALAIATAKNVLTILTETPGFAKLRGHLAQGIACGVGPLEHKWRTDRRGWKVSHPRPIDAYRIGVKDGEWTKCDPGIDTGQGIPLSTWPDKFVVHSPNAGVSLPHAKRGFLRACLPLALAKRFGLRWWLSTIERNGQPQIYATLPSEASADVVASTQDALLNLSSHWAAVFKGAASITSIPVGADNEIHAKFLTWINTEYAIAALGNNLTTEVQGGSFAASQTGDNVRGDYLAADLTELDETITDQWIAPTVRFNWPGAPVPVFETILTRIRPWTVAEYQAGACTLDEYRQSNGFDAADPGGKYVVAPAPLVIGGPSTAPAAAPVATAPAVEVVPEVALNGAQVAALVSTLQQFYAGTLPAVAVKEIILAAFPTVSVASVDRMLAEPPKIVPVVDTAPEVEAKTLPQGGEQPAPFSPTLPMKNGETSRTPRSGPVRALLSS